MNPPLDLNLIYIAESLYRTLNVSKTAHELNTSQSAVSHSLAKLRDHFNDPLFVRVSKGMAATERAKEMRARIESFAKHARELSQHTEFDPSKATGRITIATSDLIEINIMPSLLNRLKTQAPKIQISIRPTGGELPKAELESGQYDFAIAGFYKNLPEGFYQTKVLEDDFSIGIRKGHPLAKKSITAAQFYDYDHALITLQGDFKDNLARKIDGKQKERHFAFGSYSFTGIAWTLASTDLILTAPTMLLKKYQQYFPIEILKSPFENRKLEFRMIWHNITHTDPLKSWFRKVLKEELEKLK